VPRHKSASRYFPVFPSDIIPSTLIRSLPDVDDHDELTKDKGHTRESNLSAGCGGRCVSFLMVGNAFDDE